MPDHEDSLGGETFSGEEQQDAAEQSLGDGANLAAEQLSASEQPACRSGSSTVLFGLRIFAVSVMKCTPQKPIVEERTCVV